MNDEGRVAIARMAFLLRSILIYLDRERKEVLAFPHGRVR